MTTDRADPIDLRLATPPFAFRSSGAANAPGEPLDLPATPPGLDWSAVATSALDLDAVDIDLLECIAVGVRNL
jgi:hypothetical protein